VVCFLLTCRTASLLLFTGNKGVHPFISHERSVGSVSEDWQSGFSWLYLANVGAKGRMRIRARQIPVAAEGGNQ